MATVLLLLKPEPFRIFKDQPVHCKYWHKSSEGPRKSLSTGLRFYWKNVFFSRLAKHFDESTTFLKPSPVRFPVLVWTDESGNWGRWWRNSVISSKKSVVGASLFVLICSFLTLRLWYKSCQYVCHKTVTTFDRLVHHIMLFFADVLQEMYWKALAPVHLILWTWLQCKVIDS